MYYVYVLRSLSFNRLYKGFCSDLQKRLSEHNSGKTKSTKPFMPWMIAYYEEFNSINEAIARERFLKTAAGRRFLKNLIQIQVPRPYDRIW
jgi:putative endonuclease